MKKAVVIMLGISLVALSGCNQKNKLPKYTKLDYPVAHKDSVVDDYFGVKVADPYRWMENDTTQEVKEWVDAENKLTQEYLSKIPFRNALKKRLMDLVNYEKYSLPFKKHGKYYYFKNDGLQNQSVLYVRDSLNGTPRVLLDPNTFSGDGTVALDDISFSNDGKYMAYTVQTSGSDWRDIYVLDLATGKKLDDHIAWAKFTSAAWAGDGFYYSAYDAPTSGNAFTVKNQNHKIFYHKLGTPQMDDKQIKVYKDSVFPLRFYTAMVNEDESALFIIESGEGLGNDLFMQDLRSTDAPVQRLTNNFQFEYYPIETIGDTVYIYTNYNAPKYRLVKTSLDQPQIANWTNVIPEGKNVLESVNFIGGKMIATYIQDASNHAYVYDLSGKRLHEVVLPTYGSIAFSGDKKDDEAFYSFSSFTFPTTIYEYDINKNTSKVYMEPKVKFNPEDYVTEQVFYPSKDGTKIPMFITYKRGMKQNGENPVYLYAYGGFNISLFPSFSTIRIPFLENGGIYAQPNLRGGGEYGEAWHLAGTKMKKQNVFDDFIAAAEYLIREHYTNKDEICISGGSNGGLLIGAVTNQRPDLFRVALPAVGVMDMLRYHKFTIGWNWASDYGTSADSKEMFEYLYHYSPLHNIKNDGTPYPAILATTADHDDRVVPAHTFKYMATLQASNTGNAPKLVRIETKAGHGSGKPISKIIDEYTDTYSFAMYNLGMKPIFNRKK